VITANKLWVNLLSVPYVSYDNAFTPFWFFNNVVRWQNHITLYPTSLSSLMRVVVISSKTRQFAIWSNWKTDNGSHMALIYLNISVRLVIVSKQCCDDACKQQPICSANSSHSNVNNKNTRLKKVFVHVFRGVYRSHPISVLTDTSPMSALPASTSYGSSDASGAHWTWTRPQHWSTHSYLRVSTIATFCWQVRRKWSLTGCNG